MIGLRRVDFPVCCVTSDRSVSLQRVARDILKVFKTYGISDTRLVLSPNADPMLYRDVYMVITVMTHDPVFTLPYISLAREMKVRGKLTLYYTTIEGRARPTMYDYWIRRDLSFIANSRYTAEKLREAGFRVDAIVYHGVDIKAINAHRWRAKLIRDYLGLKKDDFVVGYIAGPYMRKGHELLAEAIRYVEQKDKSIKFIVLSTDKVKEIYRDVNNIIFIPDFGKLSDAEVYALYHVFDLYVHASLSEGFGLPVLEALACGIPVVHADYEPLTEITTTRTSFRVPVQAVDYKTELGSIEYELHYYDPHELGDMIIYAKDEVRKRRDEYRMLCQERAKEFDICKVYKYFVDMYLKGM